MLPQIRQAKQSLEEAISRQEDFRATFETPQGRRCLKHLMKISGVFSTTHVPGDPYASAFNEGQRAIIMKMVRFMNRDTTSIIQQIEEGLQHE
jgi:hypothetical protein